MKSKTYGDRKQISVWVAGRPGGIRDSITKGQGETLEGDRYMFIILIVVTDSPVYV